MFMSSSKRFVAGGPLIDEPRKLLAALRRQANKLGSPTICRELNARESNPFQFLLRGYVAPPHKKFWITKKRESDYLTMLKTPSN
jgi:hypothetical protein